MKTRTLLLILTLVTGLIISGCEKEPYQSDIIEQPQHEKVELRFQQKDGMLVLGKKIDDPYAIHNIRKARSNLKSAGFSVPETEIEPNKVYIRFLPQTESEWQLLKTDSTMVLYDYPLDFEIEEYGTYFHDPALPDSAITWQYTVIPISYDIPDVNYEILYEVFIPDMDSVSDGSGLKSNEAINVFYYELILESFRLTGNIEMTESTLKSKKGLFKKWNPAGNIEVYDHVLSRLIPLKGAEVHARWTTHIDTDITDANGDFEMEGFIYEVNYAIKWERGYYDIRNGNLLQAWYNGPKQKGDWNLDIWTGGESIMYATMHRAAHKHFYGDNLGIRRPILITGGKTKICYIDKYGTGVFWGDWSGSGILPDIRIWGKDINNNYRNTNVIFGFTAHELGHQSHSQYMGNIQFWQTAKVIYESWAQAVEWGLTNDEYHELGNKYSNTTAKNYNHERGSQTWRKSNTNWEYSPIFIDLIDDFNQRYSGYNSGAYHYGSTSYPDDKITGYTLSYINNNILKDSYGLSSLRDAVKDNKKSGVTDTDVDDLFALYW